MSFVFRLVGQRKNSESPESNLRLSDSVFRYSATEPQRLYTHVYTCKRTEQNDLTLLTVRDRPIMTDLRQLSLTANNITSKLTNQFIRTGLRTLV